MLSFVKSGLISKPEESELWQTQNLIANVCAIPIVMITGRLADRVSTKILVPGCIIFQMLVMTCYCFIKDPTSWKAYVLAAFQAGSGLAIIVSMFAYMQKRIPKMIRGMTIAVIAVSG